MESYRTNIKKDYPLSEADYGSLVAYCLAFARMKTAEAEIRKSGTFITCENGVKKANPAVWVQSQAMSDLKTSHLTRYDLRITIKTSFEQG